MPEKTAIDLGSVQLTLLLPLWGRAVETKKAKPLLKDETALEIISKVDFDFPGMARKIHDVTQFEWIARSIHIDRTIKEFLLSHPKASIVNAGCGLDTTFDRVDNGSLMWYDLDLPDVIELRRKFIAETPRRKFIACSFLDESWFSEIQSRDGVLFMAAGVMYYFSESQVKDIFSKLSCAFPKSEFIFDAASPIGVKTANEKLLQRVGIDESAFMKWGMQNSGEISKWNIKTEFVKEYPMFRHMK
ncbi:MAG: class I SAM-dependent methyltransferase, partial [Syntrophomonadaceae bacterium]